MYFRKRTIKTIISIFTYWRYWRSNLEDAIANSNIVCDILVKLAKIWGAKYIENCRI